jgi:apolipoprotein D and lipocalin family protein
MYKEGMSVMGLMTMDAILLVLMVAAGSAADEASTQLPLRTVASVDLTRYSGTWYEIARYPNRFQRDCQSDTMAEYTLRKDGKVQVVNSCRQKDGKTKTARGTAKVADKKTNAKLKVTFFWPFYGDYWVIGLSPDYRYAIVGEPKRRYLWVLSRTPEMDETTYQKILEQIRAAGYDPEKLIKTPQSPRSGQPGQKSLSN